MGYSPSFFILSPNIRRLITKPITVVVYIALTFSSALVRAANADNTSAATTGTIIVLGDSISAAYGIQREQGWVHLLDQYLAQNHSSWRVVNASISGETTGGALARLPGVLDENAPKVVIVELGGNDGLRGYPVKKMQANLNRIIELAQAQGAATLLAEMQIPPNYGRRYTQAFTESFSHVAEASDTVLIPFLLEQVALQPEYMQADGIHPTAVAQPLIVDAVLPHLLPLLQ
jgi:acyl-CoA thioesterase-1